MKSQIQSHSIQRRKAASLVLSIVLSFVVLLAQSIPAMSNQNTAGWIEICGDGGTYLLQVDENGEEQPSECVHCDYCLAPSGDAQGVHTMPASASVSIEFTTISYPSVRNALSDSPEQYWSACRGPPIASVENNMTPLASLFIKEPAGMASKSWGKP